MRRAGLNVLFMWQSWEKHQHPPSQQLQLLEKIAAEGRAASGATKTTKWGNQKARPQIREPNTKLRGLLCLYLACGLNGSLACRDLLGCLEGCVAK